MLRVGVTGNSHAPALERKGRGGVGSAKGHLAKGALGDLVPHDPVEGNVLALEGGRVGAAGDPRWQGFRLVGLL